MGRFVTYSLLALLVPSIWVCLSLGIQRSLLNPVANPEVKYELMGISDSSIVFIGPSTFHRRIDCQRLSKALKRQVQVVTSDGQSLFESAVIAQIIRERHFGNRIIIAGQNMEIQGRGFHQCWACSNLSINVLLEHFNDVASCFWFDAINGLMAIVIPAREPLPFAQSDIELLADSDWSRANKEFLQKKTTAIAKMRQRIQKKEPLPLLERLMNLQQDTQFEVLIPLDGNFHTCPSALSFECYSVSDSTWLDPALWQDEGHVNSLGIEKFNASIIELFQNAPGPLWTPPKTNDE